MYVYMHVCDIPVLFFYRCVLCIAFELTCNICDSKDSEKIKTLDLIANTQRLHDFKRDTRFSLNTTLQVSLSLNMFLFQFVIL